MKPFNLEAAKRGEKVITRDGRNYEPKYFEAENIYGYTEGREMVHHLTGEYIALCPSKEDLFMAESSLPEERKHCQNACDWPNCTLEKCVVNPQEGETGFKAISVTSTDGIHFRSEDGFTLLKITKSEQQASEITDQQPHDEKLLIDYVSRFSTGASDGAFRKILIDQAIKWYRNRLGEKKPDQGFTALTDPNRTFH